MGFRLFGRAWVEELECRILGHGPRAQGSQLWRGFYMGSCQNYGPFLGTLNNPESEASMSIYKPMASMYVHRVLHCPITYDFRIPAKDGVGLGVQGTPINMPRDENFFPLAPS